MSKLSVPLPDEIDLTFAKMMIESYKTLNNTDDATSFTHAARDLFIEAARRGVSHEAITEALIQAALLGPRV